METVLRLGRSVEGLGRALSTGDRVDRRERVGLAIGSSSVSRSIGPQILSVSRSNSETSLFQPNILVRLWEIFWLQFSLDQYSENLSKFDLHFRTFVPFGHHPVSDSVPILQ